MYVVSSLIAFRTQILIMQHTFAERVCNNNSVSHYDASRRTSCQSAYQIKSSKLIIISALTYRLQRTLFNVYGPKLIENISLFEHSSSMIIEFLPSKWNRVWLKHSENALSIDVFIYRKVTDVYFQFKILHALFLVPFCVRDCECSSFRAFFFRVQYDTRSYLYNIGECGSQCHGGPARMDAHVDLCWLNKTNSD